MAMDLDTIRYMAVDRATGKPYFNLEDIIQRLSDSNDAYKLAREQLLPSKEISASSQLVEPVPRNVDDGVDMTKFRQLNVDLYQKSINSHFLCNEVAAKRYSSFHSSDKYALSKT